MKVYIKSIFKLIKSNLSRFITIVLIVMLGVGFLVGLFSVAPDLKATASNFIEEQKTSEVFLRSKTGFLDDDIELIKNTYSEEGLKEIRASYEVDEYVKVADSEERLLTKVVYEDSHESQDIYKLVEGEFPKDSTEIVVEQAGNYLKAPEIGTKLIVNDKEYTVSGIVYNPWYLMKERYNSDQLQAALDMVIYLPITEKYPTDYKHQKHLYTNVYCYFGLEGNAFSDSIKNKTDELVKLMDNKEKEDEFIASNKKGMETVIKDQMAIKMLEGLVPKEEVPLVEGKYYRGEKVFATFDYDTIASTIDTMPALKQQLTDAIDKFNAETEFDLMTFNRLDNLSMKLFDMYVQKISDIALVFPIFFFIITSLVTLTSLRRLIYEERSTIGTLRGLGFSRFKVSVRYLVYGVLAASLGSLLGIALGIALIPKVIYEAYKTTCHLQPLIITYNALFISIAVLVMIALIILVIVLTLRSSLKETPASLLVPKAPPAGKRILLEKIKFIWNHLSFKYKSTIRNMIRYKRNLLMMLIGVGGCASLVLVAFGLKNSIDAIGVRQFNDLVTYDMLIKTSDPSMAIEDEKITDSYSIYYDEFTKDDYLVKVLVGDDNLNNYVNFHDRGQHKFTFTGSDFVISEQIARGFNLNIGDTVTYKYHVLEAFPTEEEGKTETRLVDKELNLTITNICENYVDNYYFIGRDNIEDANTLKANYLICNTLKLDAAEEQALGERLLKLDQIEAVQFTSAVSSAYETLVNNMNLICAVVIMFAAILALVVIFNLMNINISEREREIATLKVLGYNTNEVHGYISRETFILTLLGIGVGIGVGYGLHQFIAMVIDTTGIFAGRYILWQSYVYTILITLGFAIVVDLCFIPHYKRISMVESLKAIE